MKWVLRSLFPLVGGFLLYLASPYFINGYRSPHWPKVEGVIRSNTVYQQQRRAGRPRRLTTFYGAKVAYDYEVSGKEYSGSQVSLGDWESGNPKHAQSVVDRYPPGKKVTVFYSPADPALAVLEPRIPGVAWLLSGFGLLILVWGILEGARAISRRARCR